MNRINMISTGLRMAALAGLLAGSTAAFAGSMIKVTNNSNSPWSLRIDEGLRNPILAQGKAEQQPVELSAGSNRLTYFIQPGETCTLQFKEVKALPTKAAVEVVDKDGSKAGELNLEAKPASLVEHAGHELFGQPRENCADITVTATSAKPELLKLESEDAVSINAELSI